MPASVVFAFAAVLSALIRIVNLQQNVRLAAAIGSDISCREVYRHALYQPYWVHLKRNRRRGYYVYNQSSQHHGRGLKCATAVNHFCCSCCQLAHRSAVD